jgi:hypothetical protein
VHEIRLLVVIPWFSDAVGPPSRISSQTCSGQPETGPTWTGSHANCIKGVLTWTVDGTPIEVGPGQALCIPRGAVHRFDNLGNEDVKQLAVISPAIMGPAYFREAAEVIAAAGGPPDRAKMTDVFRRHGMTLAAPPPVK